MNKNETQKPTKEVVEVFNKQFDLKPDDLNLVKSLSLSIAKNSFFDMLVLKQASLNAIAVCKYKIDSYKNQNKFRESLKETLIAVLLRLPKQIDLSNINMQDQLVESEDFKNNKYLKLVTGFETYIQKIFGFDKPKPLSSKVVKSLESILNTNHKYAKNKYLSLFSNMLSDYTRRFIEILDKDVNYDKNEIKYNNDLIYLLTHYNMPITRSYLYAAFTDWLNNPDNKINVKEYSDTNAYFKIAKSVYLHNISVFINKEKALWSLSTYDSISSPIEEDEHFASISKEEKESAEGKSLMDMVEQMLVESTFNNDLNLVQMIKETAKETNEINQIIEVPSRE